MSVPSVKPACSIASAIRSSAARLLGRLGAKPPSSPRPVDRPALLQHRLERVVDLGAPAQRLAEGRRADRGDHELLDVDVGVGVRAAVEDVHHRHRQQVRVRAADVAEQRQARRSRPRPGRRPARRRGWRWRRARPLLAVPSRSSIAWSMSRCSLASKPSELPGRSRRATRVDGLLDALAAVAALVAVAQLDGLEGAGGGAGRHGRAARWCRRRGRPRPRRWGCRASRGSRGRRRPRCWPLTLLGRTGRRTGPSLSAGTPAVGHRPTSAAACSSDRTTARSAPSGSSPWERASSTSAISRAPRSAPVRGSPREGGQPARSSREAALSARARAADRPVCRPAPTCGRPSRPP